MISILANKLPGQQRARARSVGISLALITRILLLLGIVWLARLTAPLFTVLNNQISTRDLIMLGGGLFLLVKGTHEIHSVFEKEEDLVSMKGKVSFSAIIVQIVLLDIVWSRPSIFLPGAESGLQRHRCCSRTNAALAANGVVSRG